MDIRRVALCLSYMILYLDVCLSQKDCTGTDCPVLHNCIEEVLEVGACCATCVQQGCTCKGYQYYDCVNAGFRQGKVPQGESYFVDFGSTECSCPRGGGKITCRFIPCPDVPSNCIDVTQPADGCPQCGQIGCVQGNEKYKAGHSFQMDPCQMCYCPNDGGRLVCSPILGCGPHGGKKTIPRPVTKDSDPLRDISRPPDNEQRKPLEPSSELPLGNTLPLYKQEPLRFGPDEYDRNRTAPEPTPSLPLERHRIREYTSPPLTHSEGGFASSSTSRGDDRRREAPGETPGSQDQERKQKDMAHHHHHHHNQQQQQQQQHVEPITVGTRKDTLTSVPGTSSAQGATMESPRLLQEASGKNLRHHHGDRRERVTVLPAPADKEGRQHGHSHHGHKTTSPVNSSVPVASHAQGHEGQPEAPREGQRPYQSIQPSPTRRAPVRMREDKGDKPRRQAQTPHNFPTQAAEGETGGK